MRIVGALGVPVPAVITHGMDGDRPAILMEWCDGRTVLDAAVANAALREPLGMSMGRLQARMHAPTVPEDYWDDHRSWLSRAGPGEVELHARLRETNLRDGHILHLDFHPLNVLCVGSEATVILDWANVAVGDPRADVARTRSIFQLVTRPSAAPGFASVRGSLERAWMAGYTQLTSTLPDMTLFEIWARLVFIRDMEQYLGRPDFWMELADFDRLRASVVTLKQRAGFTH
jgi:aminoglycoside phosphotransferase (APT) family kinase protein